MANTITFTFTDDNPPSFTDIITLTQASAIGVDTDLIWSYTPDEPLNPFEVLYFTGGQYTKNRSAQFLSIALQRDLNPSLYLVESDIDTGIVVVTALSNNFAFSEGVTTYSSLTITTEFEPLEGGLPRINVRSPYFISAPIYDGSSVVNSVLATFNIYIYEGEIDTDKPSEPNYVYQKKPRYLGDNNIYIDISRQVNDFIDNKYTDGLETQCVFVEVDVINDYEGGQLIDNQKYLALNGFNLHSENVNHLPKEDLLINNRTISVLAGQDIKLPFYLGGDDYIIETRKGEQEIRFRDQINSLDILNTNDIVKYLALNYNSRPGVIPIIIADNLKITNLNTGEEIIIDIEVITECIYEPVKITFVNRQGVLQEFNTYKVSKQKLKSTNDSYNRSVLKEDVIAGVPVLSYDQTDHRTRDYNKQSTRSIELNTGYITEDNNLIMEEMLVSENIWITVDEVVHPVNLTTKNISLLSKINDQLIKYKIDFDYSYQEVQNIR